MAPANACVEKFNALPEQTGELVTIEGERGRVFTCTFTIADALVQEFRVVFTEYCPVCDGVIFAIVIACLFDVKPFGPCQL